jgi:hypothetical protein
VIDPVLMFHPDFPNEPKARVERSAYRFEWYPKGWRSDDDPDWSGLPSNAPVPDFLRESKDLHLEGYGARVLQTFPQDYHAKHLEAIRKGGTQDAGGGGVIWKNLGGDYTDVVELGAATKIWNGLDGWISGDNSIDGDDTFANGAVLLPARTFAIQEEPVGTLAGQLKDGASDLFLNPQAHGEAAGVVWWITSGVRPNLAGNAFMVGHYLPSDVPGPDFGVTDSVIVEMSLFFTYVDHVRTEPAGWGEASDFYLSYVRDDLANSGFIYGQAQTVDENAPTLDATDFDAWRNFRGTGVKFCRTANTNLQTLNAYQFWAGDGWSSDVLDAEVVVDDEGRIAFVTGNPLRVKANHWVNVGRTHVLDPYVDVYRADQPWGPWEKFARVPVPTINSVFAPNFRQASHHAFILPHSLHSTSVGEVDRAVACCTGVGLGTHPGWDLVNIRRWAPKFVVVPLY